MTREQKLKHADEERARYRRDPEPNRTRARCRKTRLLIERAIADTKLMLQHMVPA